MTRADSDSDISPTARINPTITLMEIRIDDVLLGWIWSDSPAIPEKNLNTYKTRLKCTLLRKEITLLVRSKRQAMILVTAVVSMSCGRLEDDVRTLCCCQEAIISRCMSSQFYQVYSTSGIDSVQ